MPLTSHLCPLSFEGKESVATANKARVSLGMRINQPHWQAQDQELGVHLSFVIQVQCYLSEVQNSSDGLT